MPPLSNASRLSPVPFFPGTLCAAAIWLGAGIGWAQIGWAQAQGVEKPAKRTPVTKNSAATVPELRLVWEHPIAQGTPLSVAIDPTRRSFLYLALSQGGLAVLESADRRPPREVARLGIEQFAGLAVTHLAQEGPYLFAALGEFFAARGAPAGVAIIDVRNPREPRVTARWKSTEVLRGSAGITLDGPYLYLAAMRAGIMIFRATPPDRLEHLTTFQPDIHFPRPNPSGTHHPNARGIAVRRELAYVAYDAGGLRALDIRDRRQPREVGRYANAAMRDKPQAFNQLVLHGDLAYIAVDYAGLEVVDIRDPSQIKSVGWWNPWNAHTISNLWFNSPGHTNQIALDARRQHVWLSAGDSEILRVDVSRPTQPKWSARYGTPGDKRGAWGVTFADQSAYATYIQAVIPFASSWAGLKRIE